MWANNFDKQDVEDEGFEEFQSVTTSEWDSNVWGGTVDDVVPPTSQEKDWEIQEETKNEELS